MTLATTKFELLVININECKKDMVKNAWTIGKYLNEIKEKKLFLDKYAFWSEFIKNEVKFSQDTAENLMNLNKGFPELRSVSDLSKTQCYLLVKLEPEEREEFIAKTPLKDMSTRETKDKIDEYKDEKREPEWTNPYSKEALNLFTYCEKVGDLCLENKEIFEREWMKVLKRKEELNKYQRKHYLFKIRKRIKSF